MKSNTSFRSSTAERKSLLRISTSVKGYILRNSVALLQHEIGSMSKPTMRILIFGHFLCRMAINSMGNSASPIAGSRIDTTLLHWQV